MAIWSQPIMFLGKAWRSPSCQPNGALYCPIGTHVRRKHFVEGRNVLFFFFVLFFSPFQLMIVVSGCSDFHWWERFITYFLENTIFSQVWTFRQGHPKKSLIFYFCNIEGKRNLNLPNFPLSSGMSIDTLSKTTRQRGPLCSFSAVRVQSHQLPQTASVTTD